MDRPPYPRSIEPSMLSHSFVQRMAHGGMTPCLTFFARWIWNAGLKALIGSSRWIPKQRKNSIQNAYWIGSDDEQLLLLASFPVPVNPISFGLDIRRNR